MNAGPSGSPTRGPPRRPPDRPQHVQRRPARAAVRPRLRDRHQARRRAARQPRRAPRDRRHRRLGHGRDAHQRRRRGRDPRAARRASPRWHPETRRITGLEPIPLEELGRPRIDVTVRISGFFRDAFPHLVEHCSTRRSRSSPASTSRWSMNFVRKHVLADVEELAGDWRAATARIFGGRPGTYGTGILQLVDVKNWRDDADLAEVYEAWGGHAYGKRPRRRRGAQRDAPPVRPHRRRGQERRHARARPARQLGLLRRARRDDRLRPPPRRSGPARGDRGLERPEPARRALAGRRGAARVPLARREPALDRLDDAPRLQGRVRAVRDRRLPVRLRRHDRRRRGLDVRAGDRALRRRRGGPRLPDALEPVGAAGDRRAAAGGGRARPVGRATEESLDLLREAYLDVEGDLEEASA